MPLRPCALIATSLLVKSLDWLLASDRQCQSSSWAASALAVSRQSAIRRVVLRAFERPPTATCLVAGAHSAAGIWSGMGAGLAATKASSMSELLSH